MIACGLAVLSLTLAYAVFNKGGVWPQDWNLCLLAIGLLASLYFLLVRKDQAPPLDHLFRRLLLAFAALAMLQLLPLPLPALRLLSPHKAELLDAVASVMGTSRLGQLSAAPADTLQHLLRFAGYLLVFLLIRDIAWQLDRSPWLPAVPLIAIAAAEAFLGLLQPLARGTYVNKNHFAGLLELCLPFAVFYAVAILKRTHSRFVSPGRPALQACGLLLIAAVILLAILQSLSRMGFVAALVSLFVAASLAFRKRWLPAAFLAVLALLAFILLPGDALIQRFANLASTDAISSDMRLGMWRDTINMIRDYPLFGCGLGSFESCFAKYQTVAPMYTIDFAHNDYLQFLAELGILGFAVGLALVFRLFRVTLRTAMSDASSDRRYLALACVGSLVAIGLHSIVDFNLYIPANAMLLAWIAGIAALSLQSTVKYQRRSKAEMLPPPGPILASAGQPPKSRRSGPLTVTYDK